MMVNISSVQHGHFGHGDVPKAAGLNAVELTVTDAGGDGFRTYFGLDQTLDVVMRMVAALMRLRGDDHDVVVVAPQIDELVCRRRRWPLWILLVVWCATLLAALYGRGWL
jgi:hypothetical protein